MKALLTIAILAGLTGQAAASDLSGITVSMEPDLSYWNNAGDGFHVAIKVQNDTTTDWYSISFECLGLADGAVVSRAVGSTGHVPANGLVRESTGLYHFKKPPTEVSCQATDAMDQASLDNALAQ